MLAKYCAGGFGVGKAIPSSVLAYRPAFRRAAMVGSVAVKCLRAACVSKGTVILILYSFGYAIAIIVRLFGSYQTLINRAMSVIVRRI